MKDLFVYKQRRRTVKSKSYNEQKFEERVLIRTDPPEFIFDDLEEGREESCFERYDKSESLSRREASHALEHGAVLTVQNRNKDELYVLTMQPLSEGIIDTEGLIDELLNEIKHISSKIPES